MATHFLFMNKASSLSMWSFWIGAVVVLATHVYMLLVGLPASQMMAHDVLNFVAVALMILAWVKR